MMIEIIASSIGFYFIGLVSGAKIYKNRDRLEKWSRHQLKVIGVPIE